MEKNGIHIIDLHKTVAKIDEAASAVKQIAKSGRKILFCHQKTAKDIVAERIKAVNMPYVTERWPGGMLTNFPTIRKAVKKMNNIDKMMTDGTFDTSRSAKNFRFSANEPSWRRILAPLPP
jgi:small subunit ribosomal protein S2